jgi:glycosyltransferase involved in cell wall biosynthesis
LSIDTETFRPIDQRIARDLLRLPQGKRIIFFGASSHDDERKGMQYLQAALNILAARLSNDEPTLLQETMVVMAGRRNASSEPNAPFMVRQLGYLSDELTLALAYQAADLFVCPSVEDAGPMMIPESLLCGTPVVAFDTGGAPDLIETMKTGYLARVKDSTDLANGMYELLMSSNRAEMRRASREIAAKFHTPDAVASKYMQLYQSVAGRTSP